MAGCEGEGLLHITLTFRFVGFVHVLWCGIRLLTHRPGRSGLVRRTEGSALLATRTGIKSETLVIRAW